MDITFSPPLANQIRLFIAPVHSTAVLNFTAALSSACHAQFIRDGAKLQVWSDVCLHTEKLHSTEWCAFDFQTPAPPITGSTVSLKLDTSTHERISAKHDSLLSLQLSVPLTSRKYLFSFTYRLVYSTGEIRWLGQYGQNGTIVLEQSQSDSKFILHEGWSMKNGGYVWTHSSKFVDSLEVARLSSPSDYSIQLIGSGSFLDAKKASLAFLVPRVLPHSVLLDPTYILSASPGITFTVLSSSIITASGAGSLLLQAPASSTTKSDVYSLVNNIIAFCPPGICEASTLDTDMKHLLLTSGREGRHLLKALVLPMIPRQSSTAGPIRIALSKLAALLPDEVTQYSIFSPLNPKIHFFTTPAERSDKEAYLLIDPLGGPFVLSPVFNLKDGRCQLSILSDYRSIKLDSEFDSGNLPTPPPSPYLQHCSPLSSREASSIPTSISSAPDTRLVLNLRNSSEDGSPFRRQIQTPPLRTVILAYIISMATFLFTPVYQLFFGRMREDISKWDTGSAYEQESWQTHEQEDSAVESESENTVMPVTRTLDVLAAANDHRLGQFPRSSLHSLLVETYGGNVKAAFRSTDAAISTALITVDLNGQKVDPTVTKLDEYISLLAVDGQTGGLLKITLP